MEFFLKKISEEAYKDIAPYIDAMLPYISYLGDLYTVDIDGHHLVISEEGNKFTIVDNFNKELYTYNLELDENGNVIKFIDDLNEYELSLNIEGSTRLVRSTDKISKVIEQLVYFPPVNNDPTYYIDFYQCFPDEASSAIFNYDVTHRDKTLEAALSYMHYQTPNRIVISQLVNFLKIFTRKREQIFYEDKKSDMYLRALVKFNETLLPEFNKRYPKDKVLYALEDMGYKIKVPDKMADLLCDKDSELKRLKMVVNGYKSRKED